MLLASGLRVKNCHPSGINFLPFARTCIGKSRTVWGRENDSADTTRMPVARAKKHAVTPKVPSDCLEGPVWLSVATTTPRSQLKLNVPSRT